MNSFLQQLEWRFAAKSLDENKSVSQENLEKILKAIQYTPTSYGLQAFHVYIISNKELQKKMKTISFMQPQVAQASHVLVFCARTDLNQRIDDYAQITEKISLIDKVKMSGFKMMIKSTVGKKSDSELLHWASKQAYIALGFAMAACAELQIDSCPMEGFNPEKMDKLLKLPSHLKSCLLLPIGYRDMEPKRKKIRFSQDDLFTYTK